jgi:hypothetical protein
VQRMSVAGVRNDDGVDNSKCSRGTCWDPAGGMRKVEKDEDLMRN